jgi:hypothetical protein
VNGGCARFFQQIHFHKSLQQIHQEFPNLFGSHLAGTYSATEQKSGLVNRQNRPGFAGVWMSVTRSKCNLRLRKFEVPASQKLGWSTSYFQVRANRGRSRFTCQRPLRRVYQTFKDGHSAARWRDRAQLAGSAFARDISLAPAPGAFENEALLARMSPAPTQVLCLKRWHHHQR